MKKLDLRLFHKVLGIESKYIIYSNNEFRKRVFLNKTVKVVIFHRQT